MTYDCRNSNTTEGGAYQNCINTDFNTQLSWDNQDPTVSQKVNDLSSKTLQCSQKSGFRWDTGSSGLSFPPIPPPVQSQLPFGYMSVQDQLQEIARHTLSLVQADLESRRALNEIEKRV